MSDSEKLHFPPLGRVMFQQDFCQDKYGEFVGIWGKHIIYVPSERRKFYFLISVFCIMLLRRVEADNGSHFLKVSLQCVPICSQVSFLSNHFPAVFSPQKGHLLRSFEANGRFKVSSVLCSQLCVFVCVCLFK